ncbi:MAG: metal-dependent hydrolase [Bacteroidetes bacterium]|nr:metal-dependent hydrolase [Bacteroidota bacterium]
MASAFGHAYMAYAIGSGYDDRIRNGKFLFLGILCSILPDADVIGFQFGIAYDSFWGHRGFTHSILFALLLGIFVSFLFYKNRITTKEGLRCIFFFFFCTLSHSLLDAMTSGGLGVAFFSPFNNGRYFFPWQPIQVSPIGAAKFFGERGLRVIVSEALWIGIPCSIYIVVVKIYRRIKRTNSRQV